MKSDHDHLDEFADMIDEIRSVGDVPEPSPLFWHHLSARVRDAVVSEPIPGPWWMGYWRPVLAAACTIAVVVVAVVLQPAVPPAAVTARAAHVSAPVADVGVSEMWRLIEVASPPMALDSVQEAGLMPSAYATDQAIQSLTPDQREELVRLLRKELGVSE